MQGNCRGTVLPRNSVSPQWQRLFTDLLTKRMVGILAVLFSLLAMQQAAYAVKDIDFSVTVSLSWTEDPYQTVTARAKADGRTAGKCSHSKRAHKAINIPVPQTVRISYSNSGKCRSHEGRYTPNNGESRRLAEGRPQFLYNYSGSLHINAYARNRRSGFKCRSCTSSVSVKFANGNGVPKEQIYNRTYSLSADKNVFQELERFTIPASSNVLVENDICEVTASHQDITVACNKVDNEFILYAKSNARTPVANHIRPTDYADNGQVLESLNVTLGWEAFDEDSSLLNHEIRLFEADQLIDSKHCNLVQVASREGREYTCDVALNKYGTTYSWRVKASDEYDLTYFSDPWFFRTPDNQAPILSDLSPCSITNQAANTTLTWTGSDTENDTIRFNVYLAKSVAGNTEKICDNIADTTCAVPEPLTYNTNYFWQVEATDGYGNFTRTAPCGFKTAGNSPPHKASNPSLNNEGNPIDYAAIDPLQPLTFNWQGNGDPENDAVTYQACYASLNEVSLIDISPDTTVACVSSMYTPETTATLSIGKLAYDTDYAWIVSVKDEHGNKSDWDIWQFKTKPQPIPVSIALTTEPGYVSNLLQWEINNSSDVQRYRVLRAKADEAYAEILCPSCIPPTTHFKDGLNLEKGAEYCYKLEALNSQDNALYESNQSCVIAGVSSLFTKNSTGLLTELVPVPIFLGNGGQLRIGSSDIWLYYNPSVIKVVGVKAGALIADKDYHIAHILQPQDNGFEIVRISVHSKDLTPQALTGEGALINVIFNVIGEAGSTSPLRILPFTQNLGGTGIQDENFTDIPLVFTDQSLDPEDRTESQFEVIEATRGDLDGNGIVQTADARMARLIGLGAITLTPQHLIVGDINRDSRIDAADASMIVYYALNGEWPSADATTRQGLRNGDTPITFSLDTLSGTSGNQLTATLNVANLVNTTTLNLAIVYNPAVVDSITVAPTTLTADANLVYFDDGNGTLRLSADRQTPLSGSGALATLTFTLASNGNVKTSRLLIGEAQLYDSIGRNFSTFELHDITAEHGEVTIIDVEEPPEEIGDNRTPLKDLLPGSGGSGAVYTASGQIHDQDGNPMTGVSVNLDGQTAVSDEYGYWAILGLTAGEYPLQITQDGYSFNAATCVIAEQQNCRLAITGRKNAEPVSCQLYAVNDAGLNDSQFLTVDLTTYGVTPLGPLYAGHDIEALAVHPLTNALYAASGDNSNILYAPRGFLYKVDGNTGELIKIGDTGFSDIGDLAFDAQGTLWGWAKGQGLITLDTDTGAGSLIIPSEELLDGLTFSKQSGTVLYGAHKRHIVVYDLDNGSLGNACAPGLGEMEALEMMADGLLLIGAHQDGSFKLHAFNPQTCVAETSAAIPIQPFNDVEGIALPIAACGQ